MENLIKEILTDLYQLDPDLKNMEKDLLKIIKTMLTARPEASLDESFRQNLRQELLQRAEALKAEKLNHKNMFKKISPFYYLAGAMAVIAVIMVPTLLNNKTNTSTLALLPNLQLTKVSDEAFGPLGQAGSVQGQFEQFDSSATPEAEKISSRAIGLGGGGGGNASQGSPLIMPWNPTNYKYIYTGENLPSVAEKMPVYKKNKSAFGNVTLSNLLNSFNLGPINLSGFADGQIRSLYLVQDKPYGYGIGLDFAEGNIYISENWEKWPNTSSCQDERCFEQASLKPADMPSDEELIRIADTFIAEYNINLENYGSPEVRDDWKLYYDIASSQNDVYLPEVLTVVYPLQIDGHTVHDEGGLSTGLMIGVRVKEHRVSSVSNLSVLNFQSSLYDAETDPVKLLASAEKGGYNNYYYPEAEKTVEVSLGQPSVEYVQIWNYVNGLSEQLMIPALIFPVLDKPQDLYRNSVVVPLLPNYLENLNQDGPIKTMTVPESR